ncbi:uncharacterized protein DEA37_0013929 [Paragonimus westermani]|uniref:Reverse transcriptase RNase H-like domain-containing protein n=1 Tax=Paragonimus westermani TaxID=34504 RepID=A0A5J4NC81_9TREM|nr:uncharacterized protein DEA37_0013929 [Paragonimus westermani]
MLQQALGNIKPSRNYKHFVTYFDLILKLVITADTSKFGVSGLIIQDIPDSSDEGTTQAVRSHSFTEKNYRLTEKESLSNMFIATKFHKSLQDQRFTLPINHRPLLFNFGFKTSNLAYSVGPLSSWATLLFTYSCESQY